MRSRLATGGQLRLLPIVADVKIRLLGELEAVDEGGVSLEVRGAKQRTLLALLALSRGRAVSAERLADAIWGEGLPGNPTNALQAQVAQLRRVLGAGSIVTHQGGYGLAAEVDADDFERLVEQGKHALAAGDPGAAARVLRDALAICRGEPLAEFAFAEFALGERARLEEMRLSAVEAKMEADFALGRAGDVVGELEALCREHPLRERLWALRMTALYRAGRQADALRAYAEARRILVDELGVDPGPELQRLEAMVLAHHRDLQGPSPASHGQESTGNLPATLTRFVGRQDELARLRDVLETSRLVTLVGPGGAGKSRLALEAAATVGADYLHGAWLVELAPVGDPGGVTPAIAAALGVSESGEPRRATAVGSAVDALVSDLAGRSLLIVLDNCEHVIAESAEIAQTLLQAMPGLRIVATSREALAVPGEQLVPVGPLPLSDALVLFDDRARAVASASRVGADDRDLAEEVCRQLDGLPLAIELAAARLRALPLSQLAARLDDRFRVLTGGARTALPRHQTLRAVVDWSYDLLFSDEQQLFRRIAAFVGPFTLEDAESVCADGDLHGADILDLLLRLVDKSLVVTVVGARHEAQFTQLQTLWQYGCDRLEASGEAGALGARHAAHYRQLAEGAREGLRGATGPEWKERLTLAMSNLRAALDWFIATGNANGALALGSGMAWLWFQNGEYAEGTRWLADARRADGPRDPDVSAIAEAWYGYLVGMSSNSTVGLTESEAAVAVLRTSDDMAGLADALLLLAAVLVRLHEFSRSLEVLAEVRSLLERMGGGWLLAAHDFLVAFNLAPLGRLEEAETAVRSSLERFDALGEVYLSVDSLNVLANIAEARGDLDAAAATHEALLQRCRAAGRQNYVPFRLVCLAGLRSRQGNDAAADGLYEEAIGCSSNPWIGAQAMVGQAAVARRLGDLVRARSLLDAAGKQYEAIELPAGQAAVLAGLAWWALAAGERASAMGFAVRAKALASSCGDPAGELLAETAVAAASAVAEPTRDNVEAFMAVAERRASGGLALGTLTDEVDVAALAAGLAMPGG
jgi:predicted ATPase/DNA-binding SARP family transcriptional activator